MKQIYPLLVLKKPNTNGYCRYWECLIKVLDLNKISIFSSTYLIRFCYLFIKNAYYVFTYLLIICIFYKYVY